MFISYSDGSNSIFTKIRSCWNKSDSKIFFIIVLLSTSTILIYLSFSSNVFIIINYIVFFPDPLKPANQITLPFGSIILQKHPFYY